MTDISRDLLDEISNDGSQPFALGRELVCGTPELWHELLLFRRNQLELHCTTRSAVDESGAPIGRWQRAATSQLGEELFNAVRSLELWTLPDEPVLPGQEAISWAYQIGPHSGQFTIPSDSPQVFALADLDMLMRRIAYFLRQDLTGASLVCHAVVDGDKASIELENPSTVDAVIPNPLAVPWDEVTYLRLEVAAPVPEPDPVGLGLVFQALPLTRGDSEPPWQDPFVRLPAGQRIAVPVQTSLDRNALDAYYLRGVFSDYREPSPDALDGGTGPWPESPPAVGVALPDAPDKAAAVFGRAFSEEVVL